MALMLGDILSLLGNGAGQANPGAGLLGGDSSVQGAGAGALAGPSAGMGSAPAVPGSQTPLTNMQGSPGMGAGMLGGQFSMPQQGGMTPQLGAAMGAAGKMAGQQPQQPPMQPFSGSGQMGGGYHGNGQTMIQPATGAVQQPGQMPAQGGGAQMNPQMLAMMLGGGGAGGMGLQNLSMLR